MRDYQYEIDNNDFGINKCIHDAWETAAPLINCAFGMAAEELYTEIDFSFPGSAHTEVMALFDALCCANADDREDCLQEKPTDLSDYLWNILQNHQCGNDNFLVPARFHLLMFMLEMHNANHFIRGGYEYGAICSFGDAQLSCGEARAYFHLRDESNYRSMFAKSAAQSRHRNDPKQAAKEQVRECWELWQKEPARYAGKAAFARDMLSKYEDLKSQPVIEGWCRDWESSPS